MLLWKERKPAILAVFENLPLNYSAVCSFRRSVGLLRKGSKTDFFGNGDLHTVL